MARKDGTLALRLIPDVVRIILATILAVPMLTVSSAAMSAAAQGDEAKLHPVRVVVLVDESGSLSSEDIARERDAARVIAQGELASESVVAVTGFASEGTHRNSPVDPVCPPTRLDTAENRQSLIDCINRLKPRTEPEGDETDHVNALRQAKSYLTGPDAGNDPKIVFLLTDGRLNVGKSDSFGKNLSPDDRTEAARQQIPGVLEELSRAGVDVWPLGFGDVDQEQLKGFATGSAQRGCGVNTSKPHSTTISTSADLLGAMSNAFSSARCVGAGKIETGDLPPEGTVELTVEIPPIATDSSILVFKRDARIPVAYMDPDGQTVPTSGTAGISRFEISGQSSEVEALRIIDPKPGKWTVRLTSVPGVPAQQVGATVIFQGAVQAVITVDPPAPNAGQEVTVGMQVRARRAPITDPDLLTGLTFAVELSGDGFSPVPATLADNDRDGQYEGKLTVPGGATGALAFKGSVTGIGISGDERTFSTRVPPARSDVRAQLLLTDGRGEVQVGGSLAGEASITNDSGQPVRLQLKLADPAPGTVLTVDPPVAEVAAASSTKVPFALTFGADTTLGPNQALLQLVDQSDPAVPIAQLPVSRTIVEPPGLLERLLWYLVALAALVGLGVGMLLVWRHRRRERAKVVGLRLEPSQNGRPLPTLEPRVNAGSVFRFVIRNDVTGSRADHPGAGEQQVYEIRRNPGGGLLVTDPAGNVDKLAIGARWDLGRDGLTAIVTDRRKTSASNPPPSWVGTQSAAPPVGPTVALTNPAASQTTPGIPQQNRPDWY